MSSSSSPPPPFSGHDAPDAHAHYKIGDPVLFGTEKGVIRFLDVLPPFPGTWAGVELNNPVGMTDGTFNGKRYFTCKPNCAVFARVESFLPYTVASEAADKIKRVYTKHRTRRTPAGKPGDDTDSDEEMKAIPSLGRSASDGADATLDDIGDHPLRRSPVHRAASIGTAPVDELDKAAVKIQAVMRGNLGRQKAKEQRLWEAWQKLDTKEENDLVSTHDTYEQLKSLYGTRKRQDSSLPLIAGASPTPIDDDNCPRIDSNDGKLTLDFVTALMDHFKGNKLLHYDDVLRLLAMVKPLLNELPNIVKTKIHTRLTIVGDLHGQLDDLFTIFKLNGLPSLRNSYLFNGDFVDRGQYSCEIVLVLFAFKVLYPDNIFLNRGNHEARDINSRDGFERECIKKYDQAVFDAFSDVFASLPLCHIINEKMFVVHGGLFWEDVTLQEIADFDRVHEIPPQESIMEQMLWSDPREAKGRDDNSRGCSLVFGPDVCSTFLRKNNLNLIVRSHECKHEGYHVMFNGTLITVFSASNYCGVAGNKGAFMIVQADLSYEMVQYEAKAKEKLARYRMRHAAIENDVISKLLRRIAQNRLALVDYYQKVDDDGSGTITRLQWAEGLKHVLGVDIPFLEFQSYLGLPKLGVKGQEEGRVDYMNFLDRYRIHVSLNAESEKKKTETKTEQSLPSLSSSSSSEHHVVPAPDKGMDAAVSRAMEQLVTLLYKNRFELESLFRFFDVNGDGQISLPEFRDGILSLRSLLKEPLSDEQVEKLISFFDKDGNASIEYDEFFDSFELADPQLAEVMRSNQKQRESRRNLRSLPSRKIQVT